MYMCMRIHVPSYLLYHRLLVSVPSWTGPRLRTLRRTFERTDQAFIVLTCRDTQRRLCSCCITLMYMINSITPKKLQQTNVFHFDNNTVATVIVIPSPPEVMTEYNKEWLVPYINATKPLMILPSNELSHLYSFLLVLQSL